MRKTPSFADPDRLLRTILMSLSDGDWSSGLYPYPPHNSKSHSELVSLTHTLGAIPTSSTINGSSAFYPSMVFLNNFGDTVNSFCGGILILDLDILSAAHCVNGRTIEDVVVIVGSDNAEAELRMFNWKTLLKIDLF